jgi:hypothetical protein
MKVRIPLLVATGWGGEIQSERLRLEYEAYRAQKERAARHPTTLRLKVVRR